MTTEPSADSHPFQILTPDFIMDAVEHHGFCCDGRLLALNSYENRVYQVGIEGQAPLIAKFYRPQRWTRQQILEEHQFCAELVVQELPVVGPCIDQSGVSLYEYGGFYFALYLRKGGHAPELDQLDNLTTLGRFLGRIHLIGAVRPFDCRPAIDSRTFGYDSAALISEQFIPDDLKAAYDSVTQALLELIDQRLHDAAGVKFIRTHGDCHVGNILWRDDNPHFVDLDDARMAPAIQDIWMLLSGDQSRQQQQLHAIIEGYTEFAHFDVRELPLIEVYRTLRMMHYAAWLARRWQDPAFPKAFTWFNTPRYWGEHILQLREQQAALQEPALSLPAV